jgi:hypothetical protein
MMMASAGADALTVMDARLAQQRRLERLRERRADEHDARRMRSLTGLMAALVATGGGDTFQRIRAEGGDAD